MVVCSREVRLMSGGFFCSTPRLLRPAKTLELDLCGHRNSSRHAIRCLLQIHGKRFADGPRWSRWLR
jgi:hypothetical protein